MNHTSQWKELHDRIQLEMSLTPSASVRKIFVACIFLSPLAGVLYGLSGIKRVSEKSERWLIRKNPRGYLYPNTCVVIPIWAVLYTIADVISLIMCQVNSGKKSIQPPPLHGAIELVKYSLFLGMIWTRVWATVYATPRSKFQLQKSQSKLSSSRPDRCLIYSAPIIFNVVICLGYLIPLALSGLMCVWTSSSIHHVAEILAQFETTTHLILDPQSDRSESDLLTSEGMKYMKGIRRYRKTLNMNMRLIAFVYITITAIISIILLVSTFIILKALFFQLKIYKRLAINSRRRSPEILMLNQQARSTYMNLQSIHSTQQLTYSNQLTESIQRRSQCSHYADNFQEIDLKESLLDWFPTFKRGTGIDENMWNLESRDDTPNPNVNGASKDTNFEKYQILKRYIVNTIWQQVLILIIISSYIIMHVLVVTIWCKNENGLPFTRIYLIVVEWANLTWNLGLGASLGLISCIVAFTPIPQRRTNNHQDAYDYCSEDG